jgi:hypothetical protein
MTRQALIRVLLSLLLLISQHMAAAHALTHWSGTLSGSSATHASVSDDLSSSFAQDPSCSQCLALAQLAGPLGSTARTFVLPELSSAAVITADTVSAAFRILLAFQSRAPPQA